MAPAADDFILVNISDLSDRGEGIGKTDGFTWFVKNAVPGDVAEAKVTRVKKSCGYAETVSIVSPSPYRVNPPCPYFPACGGCQLQCIDYQAQLKFKEELVKDKLRRIGGVENADEVVRPVTGMDDPWRCRDNEQFFPGIDACGRVGFGFYAGQSHDVVSQRDCLAGVKENAPILNCIRDYMEERGISPYDESTGSGLISRVQIRKGFATGDILVCLNIHGPVSALKDIQVLTERLCDLFPEKAVGSHIKSICCRRLTKKAGGKTAPSGTAGSDIINIYGPGFITDKIADLSFQISPLSFYQVNPVQTERLYRTALSFAQLTGDETVWDLYCGIGTISLFLARKSARVYGVEAVPQAVRDARDNAERNGIDNVAFFAGKAEKILPEQYEKNGRGADVIVADPPRKGCDRSCLDTMIKMQPRSIVYVSCDPATLARDIKILGQGGYKLDAVQPVDLFPQTIHIENAALLKR